MNTFTAYINGGEMVITFFGQADYWHKDQLIFETNGMTLEEINSKVNEVVTSNKVNKATLLPVELEGPFFVVASEGGIIDTHKIYTDMEEAVRWVNETYFDNFDRENDDARIFNSKEEEVYSFPDEAASIGEDYNWTKEKYVDFAVKLWRGELKEDEKTGLEDLVIEFDEQHQA